VNDPGTCSRKRGLERQVAIEQALQYGYPVVPYVCSSCALWHTGSDRVNPKRFWNTSKREQYLKIQGYKLQQIGGGEMAETEEIQKKRPKFARRYMVEMPRVCICLVQEEIEGLSESDIYTYVVDKVLSIQALAVIRLWADPETGAF